MSDGHGLIPFINTEALRLTTVGSFSTKRIITERSVMLVIFLGSEKLISNIQLIKMHI
jgi:hypothetical protein